MLVQAGHRVIAWSAEAYRDTIEASGAEFRPLGGGLVRATGVRATVATTALRTAQDADARAEPLAQALLDDDVDLVLHDQQVAAARVAGALIGLPRITLHPLYPSPPEIVSSWGASVAAAGIETARRSVLRRWGVDLAADGGLFGNYGDRVLLLSAPPLVRSATLGPRWQAVGPLLDDVPRRTPAQDRRPPLIYVAFGTVYGDPGEIAAVLMALAGLPVRVVASLGGCARATDVGSVPANATVFEFVDSRGVLASAGAHVTHAGAGSVQESLVAGVPMVCLPRGSDQGRWAERVTATGSGVTLPDLEPHRLADAVERLLADVGFADSARAVGNALQAVDGPGIVRATIDELLDSGPAS